MEVVLVLTPMRCEVKDCNLPAKWRVSLGKSMFFWCRDHTQAYMSNPDVWLDLRSAQESVRRRQ